MPDIKELWDNYKAQGFVAIGISLDTYESNWKEFLSDKDYDWVQVIDDKANWSNSVVYPYCKTFSTIPRAFMLDKYGRVMDTESPGNMNLEQLIQEALEDEEE